MKANQWIGSKQLYRQVFLLAVPIMIQNAITNFVGFLDNIMVGQLGTEQMSGVAIVNQFMFIFNLCVFGGLSGAGIFGAQFYGKGDHEGVRNTFRFKVWTGILVVVVTLILFFLCGEQMIRLFLTAEQSVGAEQTFQYGIVYFRIMIWEMIPFVVVQIYASTLRETGETFVPMVAGIVAVFVNLLFNYLLIFGSFGAPRLGVVGAAIATVLSRFIECGIVVAWTHCHAKKNIFIQGVYRSLKVPVSLAKLVLIKGSPLLVNELLWAAGVAMINQLYSIRGLDVVASVNISSTINNLFNVVFIAMGNAVAVMVGQRLGASDFEGAQKTAGQVTAFAVFCTVITGGIMVATASLFPLLYNTTAHVRLIATQMIQVTAIVMPMQAFLNCIYFTIRSGGKTGITFLFDSGFSWIFSVPVTFAMVHYTHWPIMLVYLIFSCLDFIKCIVGYFLYHKKIWIQNIVSE